MKALALSLLVIAAPPPAERFANIAECEKACSSPRRCIETRNKLAVCGAPCAWDTDCDKGQICRCAPGLDRECHRTETREELRVCFDASTNLCEVISIAVTPLVPQQKREVARFVADFDYTCRSNAFGGSVSCDYPYPLDICRMDARVIEALLDVADLPAQVRCGSMRRC